MRTIPVNLEDKLNLPCDPKSHFVVKVRTNILGLLSTVAGFSVKLHAYHVVKTNASANLVSINIFKVKIANSSLFCNSSMKEKRRGNDIMTDYKRVNEQNG